MQSENYNTFILINFSSYVHSYIWQQLKFMHTPHQFLLLSSPPAKESNFRAAKNLYGSTFAFQWVHIFLITKGYWNAMLYFLLLAFEVCSCESTVLKDFWCNFCILHCEFYGFLFHFIQWFTHWKLAFHPEERLSCCFQYEAAGK